MFTKKKFLKLETRHQHKKCAEILRHLYGLSIQSIDFSLSDYQLLISWMNLSFFDDKCPKKLSDQYHFHLQQSRTSLKEHNLLPPIRRCDREPKKDFGQTGVYLDQMRSAYNVGSILRTVEALRLGPVYFHPKTPFIDNDKVQKVSMEAYKYVPAYQIHRIEDLPRPLIALETAEEAESIESFLFPTAFTLIIGNEEYGISDEMLKEVDYLVDIPLFGRKNSLNAAAAFAMAAQEMQKKPSQTAHL